MALTELPSELLLQILDYLSVRSLLVISQTCQRLRMLATNDRLWMMLCQRKYGVKSLTKVKLREWNATSYRDLYARVLHRYGYMLGLWQGEDGVQPYGELLEVKLCSGSMQGWLIRAPAVDHLVDAVCQEHLFSLELDPGMEDCRISCCYRRLRGRNVKISKCISELSNNHELTLSMEGSIQGEMESDTVQHNLDADRDEFHSWISDEFPHLDGIWDYNRMLYRLLFHKWEFLNRRPETIQYAPLILPPPLPPDLAFPVSPGLYKGTYGSHGNELILVTITDKGVIQGQKMTGDPNVPAGKISFQALLQSPLPVRQYGTWGLASDCNIHQLVSDISCKIEDEGQTNHVDVVETLCSVPLHQHPFQVPEGFDRRGQSYPSHSVARFPARGQIAGHGYRAPRWTPAQFTVFADGSFSMLWVELRSLGCYCKAKEFN